MDEIYIQPQLTFKAGSIYGHSITDSTKQAKTAQVFMVSSLLSIFRDVLTIVPVNNLTSEYLKHLVASLIPILESLGFKVVELVSDNNAVNRKAFELFTENKILQPYVPHPLDPSRKLFFIFDVVHILKCIRNNWQTKRSNHRTMKFPEMKNDNILCAQYHHLELMYTKEKSSLVKYGHTLSIKVLYPTTVQKQNVGLALKFFNENNIVALKHVFKDFKEDFENVNDTCIFIDIIVKWWKIVNVKSVFEGQRFNDPFREAIRNKNDVQVQYLKYFSNWLKKWRLTVPVSDSLSGQTFQSLITTTEAFLHLIPYLFEKYGIEYILLSKFQSDSLESRFSSYRQLSGSNYYISYVQLLENERKIRFRNAVICSAENMKIPLKTIIPIEQNSDCNVNIECYTQLIDCDFDLECLPSDIVPVLTYIGGFTARRVLQNKKCNVCSSWLQLPKEVAVESSFDFTKDLDRGKLILPTESVVYTVGLVWYLMTQITDKYLVTFLESKKQVSVLHKLCIIKLSNSDHIPLQDECLCKNTIFDKLSDIALVTCKILINNFVKRRNELTHSSSLCDARKIKKLKSDA